MKHYILIVLLAVAGSRSPLFAQQTVIDRAYVPGSQTENYFYAPGPERFKNKFDFILPSGNRMIIWLTNLKQADSLPSMDTLLMSLQKDLAQLDDSLKLPLNNRRVDFVQGSSDRRIRIVQYPQRGEIFSLQGSDITQLKVEQDTVNLRLFTLTNHISKTDEKTFSLPTPYFVTFIVNNLSDLTDIAQNSALPETIAIWKNDVKNSKKKNYFRYYGIYDAKQKIRRYPSPGSHLGVSRKRIQVLPPYVQVGVQYVRGAWAPSLGVGLDLTKHVADNFVKHYRLIWEPYFFFSRDGASNLQLDRNDFITFKYNQSSVFTSNSKEIHFMETISIGYLVSRKGNWLEPHTVKFSLPGLQAKNVLLEPEFLFNDFFKNFSPSLKLTLYFE
jgi:hypothetical protein